MFHSRSFLVSHFLTKFNFIYLLTLNPRFACCYPEALNWGLSDISKLQGKPSFHCDCRHDRSSSSSSITFLLWSLLSPFLASSIRVIYLMILTMLMMMARLEDNKWYKDAPIFVSVAALVLLFLTERGCKKGSTKNDNEMDASLPANAAVEL